MNKNETIISVMEAFDEAERYKRECETLRARAHLTVTMEGDKIAMKEPDEKQPRWFAAIYEYGRRAIFDKYANNYYSKAVEVKEDKDGNKKAQPFGSWYKRRFDDFPDFMSREDFLAEFEPELRAMYEEKRAEAMKED